MSLWEHKMKIQKKKTTKCIMGMFGKGTRFVSTPEKLGLFKPHITPRL